MKLTLYAVQLLMVVQPCLAGIITIDSDLTIAPGDVHEGIDVIDTPPRRTTVTVLGALLILCATKPPVGRCTSVKG